MSTKYFNFNNEADLTQIELDDETGAVQFELDGQVATFETVQEFAEFYAIARNVVPENLKNWTLTEDGTHIAFVLRAGTAGLNADEITALVTGLRAAGMTPAEIGAAVASAQSIQATPATGQTHRHSDAYYLIEDELSNYSDLNVAILKRYATLERLTHLWENEYEGYDVSDFIDEMISEAEEEARLIGNGELPLFLAKSLYANVYGDQVNIKSDLFKASLVALAATRELEVYLYNPETETGQYVHVQLENLINLMMPQFENVFIENKKKFYIIDKSQA